MAGQSIYHWTWSKQPNASIENGLIIGGGESQPYYPGENQSELLTAIQRIKDEQSALEFVKHWGLLGFSFDVSVDKLGYIRAATEYTYAALEKNNKTPDLDSIHAEVADYFRKIYNPWAKEGSYSLTPKGDPLDDVICFAQEVQYLSEAKALLRLYQEDAFAADYETKEWLSNLSPQWCGRLICSDMEFFQKQYIEQVGASYNESEYYQYVLHSVIKQARLSYFNRRNRGVWVELHHSPIYGRPEGYPILRFDGLFRFILYILLAEPSLWPKRCADPTCNAIFFPTKANQEYCPPPPGVKRSRCENRHGQWLRRNRAKVLNLSHEGKTAEVISEITNLPLRQVQKWIEEGDRIGKKE